MRGMCGWVSTVFATERFFSRMSQHVALEVNLLCGGEITLCASKRLLTTVNQHMTFQVAWLIACVIALAAIEGLHSIIQILLGMFCNFVTLQFHLLLSGEIVLCKVGGWLIAEQQTKKSYKSESFDSTKLLGRFGSIQTLVILVMFLIVLYTVSE